MRIKKVWIWTIVSVPFLGMAMTLLIMSSCTRDTVITGYDRLAFPGEQTILEAKLERGGGLISPDLVGEKLDFVRIRGAEEVNLGSALTGKDGRAKITYTAPDAPGLISFQVRLPRESRFRGDPAPILICVARPEAPMIVTDIDHTIADISEIKFLTTENGQIPPLPHAPQVLSDLSSKHVVIYLTARDDQFTRKTKEWLKLKGFPVGPVLFRKLALANPSAESYKTGVLKELASRWTNIAWGLGERDEDMRAYGRNGIRGIQIAPQADSSKLTGDPPLRIRSWDEIRKIIR